ncbi:hypothetical protein FQR65_LT16751 [Abscondita terminalis]|nr:hypothetical protein FQR65_LT16751 [Abscondita terminalis]
MSVNGNRFSCYPIRLHTHTGRQQIDCATPFDEEWVKAQQKQIYKTLLEPATYKCVGPTNSNVQRLAFGRVYAFEVDGFGSHLMMDDANVPSLLALPYLGAVDVNDEVYQRTRKYILSSDNPFFFKGTKAEGIGDQKGRTQNGSHSTGEVYNAAESFKNKIQVPICTCGYFGNMKQVIDGYLTMKRIIFLCALCGIGVMMTTNEPKATKLSPNLVSGCSAINKSATRQEPSTFGEVTPYTKMLRTLPVPKEKNSSCRIQIQRSDRDQYKPPIIYQMSTAIPQGYYIHPAQSAGRFASGLQP